MRRPAAGAWQLQGGTEVGTRCAPETQLGTPGQAAQSSNGQAPQLLPQLLSHSSRTANRTRLCLFGRSQRLRQLRHLAQRLPLLAAGPHERALVHYALQRERHQAFTRHRALRLAAVHKVPGAVHGATPASWNCMEGQLKGREQGPCAGPVAAGGGSGGVEPEGCIRPINKSGVMMSSSGAPMGRASCCSCTSQRAPLSPTSVPCSAPCRLSPTGLY